MTASASRAADRLLGAAPLSTMGGYGADLLRTAIGRHGLSVPADLVSGVGSGSTTLWTINAAQMLVVANTTRDAAIDDAFECGRIAATAALSAVHARAAQPLFARLTLAIPAAASVEARQALVDGVAVAMAASAAVLADVEVVDAPMLRFDVLVAGIVRPDRVRGIAGAQPGDALILDGALGGGIYAAAHARHKLADDDRRTLIDDATRSNRAGVALGTIRNVHAVAAVGAEGLLAAALAIVDAASLTAVVDSRRVPALPRALALAKAGAVAPASSRNWNRDGARVALDDAVMPEMRSLLTDPVASGALLIACKPESAERVLKLCHAEGAGTTPGSAAVIGTVEAGMTGTGSTRRPLTVAA